MTLDELIQAASEKTSDVTTVLGAFLRNSITYRCVQTIVTNGAVAPFAVQSAPEDEDLVRQHAVLKLLSRPNPLQSRTGFMESLYLHWCLHGEIFIERVRSAEGTPIELWPLEPPQMTVVKRKGSRIPLRFDSADPDRPGTWPVRLDGTSDVLHVYSDDPRRGNRGVSAGVSAGLPVQRHHQAGYANLRLMRNNARPTGALIFKPVMMPDGTVAVAPQTVIDAADEKLKAEHTGQGLGSPLVLGGNVDWQEMAWSPRDMDWTEAKLDAARDVCAAWGVPFVLMVPGSATYNNLREARQSMFEDTIKPMVQRLTESLDRWLMPDFAQGSETLVLDLSKVPVLEAARRADQVTQLQASADTIDALVAAVPIVGGAPLFKFLLAAGMAPTKTPENIEQAAALVAAAREEAGL